MYSINVFLLDNLYNTKEEITLKKPNNYQELLFQIKQQFKYLPKYFEVFCLDKNNKELKINNEEKYRIIEDILFIREVEPNNLEVSLFEKNYNKLSDSKREKLDEKYDCYICFTKIKYENPYLCYKCQKNFHEKCLKDWDDKCKLQHQIFSCPCCRNETPINMWNKKFDYEENRIEMGNLIDKINELKENKIQQFNTIQKYSKYIEKTFETFRNILLQINSIHSMLKFNYNFNLNNIINSFHLNLDNLAITEISNIINYELEQFKLYLMNNKNNEPNIKLNSMSNNQTIIQGQNQSVKKQNNIDNNIYSPDDIDIINNNNINNKRLLSGNNNNFQINSSQKSLPSFNEIMSNNNFINNESIRDLNLYKNIINITYSVPVKDYYNIFGGKFVMNNKFNIRLNINGRKNLELVSSCELNPGENTITLVITNKLTNLSEMFSNCVSLKDIKELEFLDVENVQNLSGMFSGCTSLVDIKPLLNWNVSNCTNFSLMFFNCIWLSNINPLQFWNVSKGNDFSYMFCKCTNLSDIKPLQNWNVSNGGNFISMFLECPLNDLTPIQKWNVSKELLNYIK